MNKETTKTWALALVGAGVISVLPGTAAAAPAVNAPFAEELCAIANWFTGDTGSAIATVAIIFLGIAAFFGKVTWGLALMFAVGVFAIFGAGEIVSAISDGQSCSTGG
jgi:type IV secretory pathway VirB2 component (pilin)